MDRLGVRFADPSLLHLALIHPSALNEGERALAESNQRLEFLGDAVVGLAVASELYRLHPDWSEGRLTGARSELISGQTLAEVAAGIGLGQFLVMGRGETEQGGQERPSNLADALEAVIGARLLDAGYESAAQLVLRLLGERVAEAQGAAQLNEPGALLELAHTRGSPSPIYAIMDATSDPSRPFFTADVEVDGEVVGRGSGPSKAAARREAARMALANLSDSSTCS